MDYETQLNEIIERLSQCIDEHNEDMVRKAYEDILVIGTENDFWCEVFYESEDWDIKIAAEVKRKHRDENGKTSLNISDLCLIRNFELFSELLQGEVDMDPVEQCLEALQDEGDTKKIQLISRKLQQTIDEHMNTNQELTTSLNYLEYYPAGPGYTSLFTARNDYSIAQK